MSTNDQKETKHLLAHSGLTGYRSFYWSMRIFVIVILLGYVIHITIEKAVEYDKDEIISQMFLDNMRTINRLKHEGFARISFLYFPCDLFNFFAKNWLYDRASHATYRDLVIKFSEKKHIENIAKYVEKKDGKQFGEELNNFLLLEKDPMFYHNSIAMHGYKNFIFMTAFIYQFFAFIVIAYLIAFYDRKFPRKYTVCPYKECRKSVLVYGRWICKHCDSKQPKDKFVYEKCTQCGRLQNTETCESCGREFYI